MSDPIICGWKSTNNHEYAFSFEVVKSHETIFYLEEKIYHPGCLWVGRYLDKSDDYE
jgi:hypothetical protein